MDNQIVILAMPHSGISPLANQIQPVEINCGNGCPGTKATKRSLQNSFGKLKDIQQLHESLLQAAGGSWSHLKDLDLLAIDKDILENFHNNAKSIVSTINKNSLGIIADPRLCILLPLWKKVLDRPICIIIWYDPLSVAASLHSGNNFFINQGIALWEYYTLAALKNSADYPRILISHADFLSEPRKTIQQIVHFLHDQGVVEINNQDSARIEQIIDHELQHYKPVKHSIVSDSINGPQNDLVLALRNKTALNWRQVPDISPGALQAINELEQLENIRKSVYLLEETAVHTFSLLNSIQYKLSQFVFATYRKLRGKKGDALSLFAKKNLDKTFRCYSSLKVEQFHKRKTCAKSAPPVVSQKGDLPAPYRKEESIGIDIVICVHNALKDLQKALTSIEMSRAHFVRLIIVNDGSALSTSDALRSFASKKTWCTLLENSTPQGYTVAANQGLKEATAPFIVLTNSDVVVPREWLQILKRCAYSSHKIGMVGPLSNAATWQSIPKRQDESGKWSINTIPSGWSVDKVQSLVANISERRYPRVQLLNGFCLGIKRAVFEKIGYLDEKAFPQGYGEENDFCIRAARAGFELAIADNLFVYHAKSKSFGSVRREELSKRAAIILKKKYGITFGTRYTKELRKNTTLDRIRRRVATAYLWNTSFNQPEQDSSIKILFLLPCKPGSGGVNSVIQEVQELNRMNIFTTVAVPVCHRSRYKNFYDRELLQAVYFYSTYEELLQLAPYYDVIIATIFNSVGLLKKLWKQERGFVPAYYIQDYEPWFVSLDFATKWLASRSYTLIPDLCCFAKTDWICNIVLKKHKVKVHRIMPSLDHTIFFSESRAAGSSSMDPIHITAMIRPRTPRRRASKTIEVLKTIQVKFCRQVFIHFFGTNITDPVFIKMNQDFDFINHGFLTRESVSSLLRKSDIFLDMSKWQAFGRTGIEAMACGCVPVLPIRGGVDEYAIDRHNAMIVDTDDKEKVIATIQELVKRPDLLLALKENGLRDVKRYSITLASRTLALLFMEQIHRRKPKNT